MGREATKNSFKQCVKDWKSHVSGVVLVLLNLSLVGQSIPVLNAVFMARVNKPRSGCSLLNKPF